jgi:O-antigen ligase
MSTDVAVIAAERGHARSGAASRLSDRERVAVGSAVAATALLPLVRPPGPGATAPVDALIVVALLAALLWFRASRRPMLFPYAVPAGLLLVGGALGAISGPVPRTSAVALVQDAALLLWFWALINIIGSSSERLRLVLSAWAYSAIAWAFLLILALAGGITAISGQTAAEGARTALTFGNANSAGSYFFISIMVIWATGRPQGRVARTAAYAVLLAALLSTGSNGALIAIMVGTVVACVAGVYRRRGPVAATTALAAVVLAGVAVTSQFSLADVESRASASSYAFVRDGVGRSAKTASDRGLLFRESVHLYRTGGPLGSGPGSTKVRLQREHAPRALEAHNDYLAALNERGIVGLLGAVFLLGGIGVQSLSLAGASIGPRISRAVVRPNALAGATAGALVAMTSTEYLHVRHVWTLLALVVAAALVGRK